MGSSTCRDARLTYGIIRKPAFISPPRAGTDSYAAITTQLPHRYTEIVIMKRLSTPMLLVVIIGALGLAPAAAAFTKPYFTKGGHASCLDSDQCESNHEKHTRAGSKM
jgi:hypothetical protein